MTRAGARRIPREVTIAEARFLLSCGESVDMVARALGMTLSGLEKAAYALGAGDVSKAVNAARRVENEYRRAA